MIAIVSCGAHLGYSYSSDLKMVLTQVYKNFPSILYVKCLHFDTYILCTAPTATNMIAPELTLFSSVLTMCPDWFSPRLWPKKQNAPSVPIAKLLGTGLFTSRQFTFIFRPFTLRQITATAEFIGLEYYGWD